jgi:hypothetical protein
VGAVVAASRVAAPPASSTVEAVSSVRRCGFAGPSKRESDMALLLMRVDATSGW